MSNQASPLPPGGRVELPGRGAPWVWEASGPAGAPTVILLHGWTSTAALNWYRTMKPLSGQFRVLAPDLRGHGRGLRSRRPFRLEDCADDVAALVRARDLGPVIVVGYSMGGAVAQLVGHRHPEVVQGLVLSATAARFAPASRSQLPMGPIGWGLSLAAAGIPEPLRQAGLHRYIDRRTVGTDVAPWAVQEWKYGDPVAIMQAGMALASFDSTNWLPEIDTPTSVVVTTQDTTVPPRSQWYLARAIPAAVALTVQGDHRACVDRPRAFNATLAAACQRLVTAGASRS